jgi:hypothetical protein
MNRFLILLLCFFSFATASFVFFALFLTPLAESKTKQELAHQKTFRRIVFESTGRFKNGNGMINFLEN